MIKRNSFTFKLTAEQQAALLDLLKTGNYRPTEAPHTRIAVEGPDYRVNLYNSGKCLIQGKGAQDWVTFVLEPSVLLEARVGYEEVLNPELTRPHMGVDESGKGDFFGSLVIAAAYVDKKLVSAFEEMGVKDSKNISSDKRTLALAADIRKELAGRFALIQIGPRAYNRLYAKVRNVNTMLAWGHARAIENLMEKVPDCPRAVSDQFGPTRQIENALMKKGRKIKLEQRPKAESDPAVAAASILARAAFLAALAKLRDEYKVEIPKGASTRVQEAAAELVKKHGPEVLLETAKCHFKTTDVVLQKKGLSRDVLGAEGMITFKPKGTPYIR